MSFPSWLQNLRSALAPGRSQGRQRQPRSPRTATQRPVLEVLDNRTLPSFSAPSGFAAGTFPNTVVTTDFNGDGRLDLAVLNVGSDDVSVLLGTGDGAFQATRNRYILGGWQPHTLAVGDFNGDGRPDIVAPSSGSSIGGVEVFLGNGDGSFQQSTNTSTEGNSSLAMAVGDFDGDGNLDLAVTGFTADYVPGDPSAASEISVLMGHGDGTFAVAGFCDVSSGLYAPSIATGDFNSDGKLDLVFADQYAGAVGVMLGDGNFGGFTAAQYFAAGSYPVSVAVADLNGDGKLDLVTANSGSLSVLLGNGDGAFQAAKDYATGSCGFVAVADFNGDGKPDLVTEHPIDDSIGVLLGDGDGSFGSAQVYAAGGPNAVAAGDFNGDGWTDVAAASTSPSTVSVLLNDGIWGGPPPAPSLRINNAIVTEGNTGTGAATFTVSLSAASTNSITIDYMTGDATATSSNDYQAASGTLTFAPGETSKIITVLVNGDRLAEPNETFAVNLTGATNANIADGQGIATILDDEPRISITDATVNDGNSGTRPIAFTVSMAAAYDVPVPISYATANYTATAGSDYQAKSGTLTIPAGQTSGTITVLVYGDRIPEPNETFIVNLSGPTNATITDGTGLGTIIDDEPRISISDVSKSEGKKGQTTLFTFNVTLSVPYDQPVSMSFRTVDGTANTSDGDYVAKTGSLTFAPGETTKTITIEVKGDSKKEANETFGLELFGSSSNSKLLDAIGVGTILNDD